MKAEDVKNVVREMQVSKIMAPHGTFNNPHELDNGACAVCDKPQEDMETPSDLDTPDWCSE